MYLGCSSQSYSDDLRDGRLTLPEWFRLCAEELGVGAVEVEDKHVGDPTPARLDSLHEAAARHRVEIVNIALMNNFGVADDARRRGEEERTVAWMSAARRLGTRFLRTFAGWPEGDPIARRPAMLDSLRSVCARAESLGVRLVFENHNHGGFVQTADDVEAIARDVASPALGLLLDTGNFLDGIESIRRTVRLAWHVHAKFTRVGPDGRDARVDNEAAIRLLAEGGFTGCISVEYEGEEPGGSAVPRAIGNLRRAIEAAPLHGGRGREA
jgi:sugar phosphate isomerase/epimerase